MVVFPNAKINIGLFVTGKRPDGYHNLESIFYPIALKDMVEIIPNPDTPATNLTVTYSGIPVPGDPTDNLCSKAINLIRQDFPELPPLCLHLHKHIPMGAGMGGGSADAAFCLQLVNHRFDLNLSADDLLAYALQIGSDCGFFLYNQPCFVTGRGEKLLPIPLDLSGYRLLIVHPGIHIPTGWAFAQLKPRPAPFPIQQKISIPVSEWKHWMLNDFEIPVFQAYPEIAGIKEKLYQLGAHFASMSGSGSTVYGLFPATDLPATDFPDHYFCKWV